MLKQNVPYEELALPNTLVQRHTLTREKIEFVQNAVDEIRGRHPYFKGMLLLGSAGRLEGAEVGDIDYLPAIHPMEAHAYLKEHPKEKTAIKAILWGLDLKVTEERMLALAVSQVVSEIDATILRKTGIQTHTPFGKFQYFRTKKPYIDTTNPDTVNESLHSACNFLSRVDVNPGQFMGDPATQNMIEPYKKRGIQDPKG